MPSEQISYPSKFFSTNEIILIISGLKLPKNMHSITKFLYLSYSFFLYLTSLIFFLCETIKLEDTIKEPTKFFSHIGMLFTHAVGILKCCVLVFSRSRIQKVMALLQDEEFRYEAVDDFQPGQMLYKGKKKSSNLSILVFFFYNMVGVLAVCSSWISINLSVKGQAFKANMSCYDFLPYFFKIPFPADTKSQCEQASLFMGMALCTFAWIIACHDGLFCALLHCLKTQMDVVGEALRTIRSRTLKKLVLPRNCVKLYDDEYPELEDTLYKELNRCILHLTSLLQANDDLEDIFTYIALAQTLGSILIISSCLFVAATVPVTSPTFFSQAEYFFCILLQLWLICNFGNEITFSSTQITYSLYESDWFSSSLRYKKSMIMIMCRMQRPLYLSIGKFTPLTLMTFMAVCRGAFSYFAVFRSI